MHSFLYTFSKNCNKPVTDKVSNSTAKLGTLRIKPEVCIYVATGVRIPTEVKYSKEGI